MSSPNRFRRHFIALAAPSGGGKTTLCRMLLDKYPETCLSISFTTRKPRGAERDGVEYHFVDEPRFQQLIQEGAFIEWAKVHGNYYGTSRVFLEEQCRQGKVVLLDVDVQGVDSLKSAFGERCLSVFVLPPDMLELEKRLRARQTESEEKLQERLRNAREEMSRAHDFDYRVVNRDLNESIAELCSIVEREVGLAK
jgi:guanylate kinase